jgi:hypothetical protein
MISVITWDAEFRESYHMVDFFTDQDLPNTEFEFIWVDYYNSTNKLKNKLKHIVNSKLISLKNSKKNPWHMGQCLNAGVNHASGEVLIIADGDIAVEHDFLSYVWSVHQKYDDLVLYFKRYDEPKSASCTESRHSLPHLKKYSNLINPTNFAACLSIKKNNYTTVKGFENHNVFSGPGANALELNVRLRNAGFGIRWSEEKNTFHPWHPSSGSTDEEKKRKSLRIARQEFDWILPYAGLEQSWIIYRRGILGQILADERECNRHAKNVPDVNLYAYIRIADLLKTDSLVKFFKKRKLI